MTEFKRVIELRQDTKKRRDAATYGDRQALDIEQNQLKLAVNATSYGALIEVNVSTRSRPASTAVHRSKAQPFRFSTDNVEKPGPYFLPLLATLIAGAARQRLERNGRLANPGYKPVDPSALMPKVDEILYYANEVSQPDSYAYNCAIN